MEYKQWWLPISPKSTKRTITSHLKSLNIRQTMYEVGNAGPGLGQTHKCGIKRQRNKFKNESLVLF